MRGTFFAAEPRPCRPCIGMVPRRGQRWTPTGREECPRRNASFDSRISRKDYVDLAGRDEFPPEARCRCYPNDTNSCSTNSPTCRRLFAMSPRSFLSSSRRLRDPDAHAAGWRRGLARAHSRIRRWLERGMRPPPDMFGPLSKPQRMQKSNVLRHSYLLPNIAASVRAVTRRALEAVVTNDGPHQEGTGTT